MRIIARRGNHVRPCEPATARLLVDGLAQDFQRIEESGPPFTECTAQRHCLRVPHPPPHHPLPWQQACFHGGQMLHGTRPGTHWPLSSRSIIVGPSLEQSRFPWSNPSGPIQSPFEPLELLGHLWQQWPQRSNLAGRPACSIASAISRRSSACHRCRSSFQRVGLEAVAQGFPFWSRWRKVSN